ncbi:hypothetical protein H310_03444 [Aphanomyces invadans]|uniref:Uncharacterized protein n=1 Tax=Aphanomyces invadans TaxID=157072 RepID=A0A024UIR6_9STRA|nr:hypothetical protein H310_03444 [Aphanomyces invadans]ETW05757.1 hypothetical protein H310_03444 [Aphanomyces invadans]|eukprot:XP_008865534.1 hypothetical protein H310_03444 [Aphanomyces invadans]
MELSVEQRIADGNALYKEGRYTEARREYSAAIHTLDTSADATPTILSRILANRAQTYLQERDYALALKDAEAAVESDPLNVKAHMRRVIATENLEKFETALKHVRHMLTLSLDASTLSFALTTQRRLKCNCKSDTAAAKAERYEVGKLVHSQQSIRLNFGSMLPSHLPVSQWVDVVFFVANEFGLFQRGLVSSSVPLSVSINSLSGTSLKDVALEIDSKSLPVEIGVNGKTTVRLRIISTAAITADHPLPRLSLRGDLAKGHHLDDVLPVVSLPIQATHPTSSTILFEHENDPLGIQCCRSVWVDGAERFITLAESPGNLGTSICMELMDGWGHGGIVGIGGKLWDSSLILTAYLAAHPEVIAGQHVIELGSGLGLIGLACAALSSAASVVLTDIDDVVPLLEYNVRLNDLQDEASVRPLWWGTSIEHLSAPYDVVLMSDVVYDPFGYEPLIASLRDLTTPSTTILMGHRSRHPQEKQFFDSLDNEFTLTPIPIDEQSGAVWAHPSRMTDVKLFSIRKKN